MTKRKFAGLIFGCICWATTAVVHGQVIEWIGETGDYNDGLNWATEAVPETEASVSNGGVAILDDFAPDLANLRIGQLPNSGNGTLELRSGAELFVDVNTRVGESSFNSEVGFGRLSIDRDAALITFTLTSGGDPDSAIVLGAGGNSGTARLVVDDTATLSRNLRIVGPDVEFSSFLLNFTEAHTYTAEFTGAKHSVVNVADEVMLNGSKFHADFSSFTPGFGDSWTLIDAASVVGEFSQATATGLPPGAGVFLSYADGGENGQIANLTVDARLNLTVDRGTGNVMLENRSPISLDISGYTFQGIDGVDSSDAATLAPESALDLGAIYEFTPSTIGEVGPAVALTYASGADSILADVEFVGVHNNVVLLVDPDTGEAALQNQSGFDIDMDGYLIYSPSGSLDQEGWIGLGNPEFTSVNPTDVHLAELNLNSAISLGAESTSIGIGSPFDFDAVGAEQDLVFEFHLAGGGTIPGVVEYGAFETVANPLDCNLDGGVNLNDLSCILVSGGPAALAGLLDAIGLIAGDLDGDGTVAFADFLTLSGNFGTDVGSYTEGDIDGDGSVAFADFLTLSGNFGLSSAAGVQSVPEPSSLWLAACGVLGLLRLRTGRVRKNKPKSNAWATAQTTFRFSISLGLAAVLTVVGVSQQAEAQTLTPVQKIFVADSSDRDIFDPGTDPGPLDDEGDLVARERSNLTQDTRQIRTFLEFDLSSITPAAVANPNWSATFLVDFVTRLNSVNDMSVVLGRVLDDSHPLTIDGDVAGDSWTTEAGSLPLFEWGRTAGESTDPEFTEDILVVIENARTDPFGTKEVDVTDIVASWVNGDFDNNGFSLAGALDIPQGAGLSNARLIVGSPGDFNGDGLVDFADFLILGQNFLSHLDGPVTAGDVDFDGDVDLDDFGQFKELFSQAAGAVAVSAVPEPSGILLGFIASLFCLRWRSSRSHT